MRDEAHRSAQECGPSFFKVQELERQLDEARAELAHLTEEFNDLQLLYEATIDHGEAVEDQLAEKNVLLERTQKRLEAELQDASRYLLSALPPPRSQLPATDWLLIPSTELGGDSLGYHEIEGKSFAFYLLDVCGHGVGAALLSATVIGVLRTSALGEIDFRDPAAVLQALNRAFPMERQNNMFFTIWYGVYDRSTRRLRFATGGHPPAIHLRGNDTARPLVTKGGMAIGAMEDAVYETAEITVEAGDRILLLSDGTFELEGPDGDMLSFDDLMAFSTREGCDGPRAILDWVRSFNGAGPLPDDFSLLRVTF